MSTLDMGGDALWREIIEEYWFSSTSRRLPLPLLEDLTDIIDDGALFSEPLELRDGRVAWSRDLAEATDRPPAETTDDAEEALKPLLGRDPPEVCSASVRTDGDSPPL